jgi:hypothetical protein
MEKCSAVSPHAPGENVFEGAERNVVRIGSACVAISLEPTDRRDQLADVRSNRFVHGYLCFTSRVPRSLYVATVADRADARMKAP